MTTPGPHGRSARLAAVALAVLALAGCSSGAGAGAAPPTTASSAAAPALRGDPPPRPYVVPDVTLTDTTGARYDLRARTRGRDTLVFFGYTHCPDECPAQMATLSAALRDSSADVAARTTVVFVSSDPHRDTPARLTSWLSGFAWPAAVRVVGLTGAFPAVAAAGRSLDVPLEPPVVTRGEYEVTHGTQVVAFDATGTAKVLWLNGTSPADVTHDLPLLETAAAPGSPATKPFAPAITVGDLQLGDGQVVGGTSSATAALTVRNAGDRPETLLSVSSPDATSVALTGLTGAAVAPPRGDLVLRSPGPHLALTGLRRPLTPGDSVTLVLRFARQGAVSFVLPVIGT